MSAIVARPGASGTLAKAPEDAPAASAPRGIFNDTLAESSQASNLPTPEPPN
ncbi:hypothetical protein GCM10010103_29060 [Streptomyces paradoxus]